MTHPSTLTLHRLRLGELPDTEVDALRDHLDTCPACAARVDHQRAVRAEFVRMPMPAALEPQPSWWERLRGWHIGLAALPVTAALAVAVLPMPNAAPLTEETRTKGGLPALEAWIQTGDSARPLYTNEVVKPGARVQLKFDAAGHRFVTLAGRDGAGRVELYSTIQAGEGVQTAPFALTLDDTPGAQTFYAVLTDGRPDPEDVLTGLGHKPAWVDGAAITQVVLRKE